MFKTAQSKFLSFKVTSVLTIATTTVSERRENYPFTDLWAQNLRPIDTLRKWGTHVLRFSWHARCSACQFHHGKNTILPFEPRVDHQFHSYSIQRCDALDGPAINTRHRLRQPPSPHHYSYLLCVNPHCSHQKLQSSHRALRPQR